MNKAHLLDMQVLRKLKLLFERFPKKHNLILFEQRDLLYYLSMNVNQDIKSRITYSENIAALNDDDLERYIVKELETARLGINTFDSAATELIIRSAQGNLRLCRNLCYGSLIEACRETKKIVTITHVNNVLVQPHWHSHEELTKWRKGAQTNAYEIIATENLLDCRRRPYDPLVFRRIEMPCGPHTESRLSNSDNGRTQSTPTRKINNYRLILMIALHFEH
ncbi:MAG: hypothetical protein V3T17_10515 [Pseudomonadales bacterium]